MAARKARIGDRVEARLTVPGFGVVEVRFEGRVMEIGEIDGVRIAMVDADESGPRPAIPVPVADCRVLRT